MGNQEHGCMHGCRQLARSKSGLRPTGQRELVGLHSGLVPRSVRELRNGLGLRRNGLGHSELGQLRWLVREWLEPRRPNLACWWELRLGPLVLHQVRWFGCWHGNRHHRQHSWQYGDDHRHLGDHTNRPCFHESRLIHVGRYLLASDLRCNRKRSCRCSKKRCWLVNRRLCCQKNTYVLWSELGWCTCVHQGGMWGDEWCRGDDASRGIGDETENKDALNTHTMKQNRYNELLV